MLLGAVADDAFAPFAFVLLTPVLPAAVALTNCASSAKSCGDDCPAYIHVHVCMHACTCASNPRYI
jgi:hypothetical protein